MHTIDYLICFLFIQLTLARRNMTGCPSCVVLLFILSSLHHQPKTLLQLAHRSMHAEAQQSPHVAYHQCYAVLPRLATCLYVCRYFCGLLPGSWPWLFQPFCLASTRLASLSMSILGNESVNGRDELESPPWWLGSSGVLPAMLVVRRKCRKVQSSAGMSCNPVSANVSCH